MTCIHDPLFFNDGRCAKCYPPKRVIMVQYRDGAIEINDTPNFGTQPAPSDYRIANRPDNPNWHGVAAWFDEAAERAGYISTDRSAELAYAAQLAAEKVAAFEAEPINYAAMSD